MKWPLLSHGQRRFHGIFMQCSMQWAQAMR